MDLDSRLTVFKAFASFADGLTRRWKANRLCAGSPVMVVTTAAFAMGVLAAEFIFL